MEWDQDGLKISLTGNGKFIVEGDSDQHADLETARRLASSMVKRDALTPLSLTVLMLDGETSVLEGIHGNTGSWKFKRDGKPQEWGSTYSGRPAPRIAYYDHPTAKVLVDAKNLKLTEIEAIDLELSDWKITLESSRGRPSAGEIVALHERLTARVAEIHVQNGLRATMDPMQIAHETGQVIHQKNE